MLRPSNLLPAESSNTGTNSCGALEGECGGYRVCTEAVVVRWWRKAFQGYYTGTSEGETAAAPLA